MFKFGCLISWIVYNCGFNIFSSRFTFFCSSDLIKRSFPILRPVQLGPNFCLPITGVCIPCAFFLEANGEEVIKVVVSCLNKLKLKIRLTLILERSLRIFSYLLPIFAELCGIQGRS